MIVTITPNPSLDRSVLLDRLDRGEVHRAGGVRVEPGGKGVNVARALTATDHSAVALLPTGRAQGSNLAELVGPGARGEPPPHGPNDEELRPARP